MMSNITKTTAITNSKQSLGSAKVGVDDLTAVNVGVGLPKINSKANHLAAIDDDYAEEDYDERMPSKPKGVSNVSDEEVESGKALNLQSKSRSREQIEVMNNKSSSVGADGRQRKAGNRKGQVLPQVSSRSRQSFEEGAIPTAGAEAYSNAGDGRESRHRGVSGLQQSPSVISLHDQSKASI